MGHQGVQGLAAAANLGDGNQMAGVVYMENRLNAQHGAEKGRCRGNPAAPFQVVQIVYGEPVAQMEFVLLEPLVNFVDRFAVHLHFGGVIGQQPFAHGGGKGIHHVDFPLRIFGGQLFFGHQGALAGAAEARGKGQVQDVLPSLQNRLHPFHKFMGIDLSSGGGLAGPEEPVKGPGVHFMAIRIVPIALSINGKLHGDDCEL